MKLALKLFILILALGLLGTYVIAKIREARIEARYPPIGQTVQVNGKNVQAYVTGSGPDLVMIHGSSGNMRDLILALEDTLAPHFRLIIFDRPGLGYSDRLSADGDKFIDQAMILRDAAKQLGAEKPIVLGHSLGGIISMAWATQAPDDLSALALISPVVMPFDTPTSTYYKMNKHPIIGPFINHFIGAFHYEGAIQNGLDEVFTPIPRLRVIGMGWALNWCCAPKQSKAMPDSAIKFMNKSARLRHNMIASPCPSKFCTAHWTPRFPPKSMPRG